MRRVEVSPEARAEIAKITASSHESFGTAAAQRYAKLIETGVRFVAKSPEGRMTRAIGDGLRTLHLRHLPDTIGVKTPRHIIAYRFTADRLDLLHVFHDAMDLPTRLSDL